MPKRRGGLAWMLDLIERVGNRLPNPVTLFIALAGLVVAASAILSRFGISLKHPKAGEPNVEIINLLTADGIEKMFRECVENFTGFAPLGTVLVALLGIGVAERSGLIAAVLRLLVTSVPKWAITATVVFAGIMSNMASDAGYVVLPPLAAVIFAGMGRHPLAGIAAAFAGVSAGFSANLLPSTADVLLAGLTEEAAHLMAPQYAVDVPCNYFFMFASVPLLTIVGTWVTVRIVEPRLGTWKGNAAEVEAESTVDAPAERRGLIFAVSALIVTLVVLALLVVPDGAPLRDRHAPPVVIPQGSFWFLSGEWMAQFTPFLKSMVSIMLIAFFVPGLAFGLGARTIRNDHDVAKMAGDTMGSMGTYIVLAFAAAQFVKYFEWSNLGKAMAIGGANWLEALNFKGIPLFLSFMLLATVLNLFIGSASAKWAVMAPVFVPMFMNLGYSPEATQALYRVADSVTNIITPLMPYFPLVVAFAQKYQPKIGIGSMIALMLPYSIWFGISWTLMLIGWLFLEWPVGPGAALHYTAG
jgi:aminobenzoyl-glutamate transport protein